MHYGRLVIPRGLVFGLVSVWTWAGDALSGGSGTLRQPTVRRRLAPAIAACALMVFAWPRVTAAQSWEDLEARHAILAGVEIVVTDVFDVAKAADNTWVGRAANAIHMQTRRGVVLRELLFAVGDPVDARRIHETERNLRRYSFIRDARVTPARVTNDAAWARVEVSDAWSLRGGVNLSRAGGSTTWGARLGEANLLGRGKRLSLAHESNRERATNEVSYTDPQFLDSRWVVSLRYSALSDGTSRLALLQRPYYSIETPYAVGGVVSSASYSLTQYHLGNAVLAIASRTSASTLFASHAYLTKNRTAFRLGAAYQARQDDFGRVTVLGPGPFPIPDALSRRLRGLSATLTMVQDRSATFENLASIGHTEDYNLGWLISGSIGYFAMRLGSTTSAPFGAAGVSKGWRTGGRGLVLASAGVGGRHEVEGWRESAARADVTAYNWRLKWHTLAANVHVASVAGPDPTGWLYLDSTAGLRGYPDHFLAGDRRVVISVDDRIITEWRLLGLLQVGFVGYADAGAIRRFDTGRWSRTYANVGAGLRFGSLKGGQNSVVQASVAFPLVRDKGMDRALVVFGNTVRF